MHYAAWTVCVGTPSTGKKTVINLTQRSNGVCEGRGGTDAECKIEAS